MHEFHKSCHASTNNVHKILNMYHCPPEVHPQYVPLSTRGTSLICITVPPQVHPQYVSLSTRSTSSICTLVHHRYILNMYHCPPEVYPQYVPLSTRSTSSICTVVPPEVHPQYVPLSTRSTSSICTTVHQKYILNMYHCPPEVHPQYVPLVEFICLVFACMPGTRLGPFAAVFVGILRALSNSLVYWLISESAHRKTRAASHGLSAAHRSTRFRRLSPVVAFLAPVRRCAFLSIACRCRWSFLSIVCRCRCSFLSIACRCRWSFLSIVCRCRCSFLSIVCRCRWSFLSIVCRCRCRLSKHRLSLSLELSEHRL